MEPRKVFNAVANLLIEGASQREVADVLRLTAKQLKEAIQLFKSIVDAVTVYPKNGS
jgi:uncharacterized protein (DUF433 family)